MATKKLKGLGLGLEALLGPRVREVGETAADAKNATPHTLKLTQLQPGKYQPRTRMDEGSLYELAESIKAQGVMQPVLVRRIDAERYEVIAGERRMRAAKLAGLDEVPVLVKDVPDEAAAAMALIENIQREDLNPLEEAQGLKRLIDEFGLTHETAARAVGRSRSAATNLLRLLNLTAPVQQLLLAGDLDMGHARALLPMEGAQQILSANQIVAKKLSVREAEKLVARASADAIGSGREAPKSEREPQRAAGGKPRDLLRIEHELSDLLTAPVEIRMKSRASRLSRGEIALRFDSLDELNGLLGRLGLANH